MGRNGILFVLGLLAFLFPGCRSSASYLGNRWSDLVESFDADVGAGIGAQLYVGASHVAQIGFGAYETDRIGWRRGEAGAFRERRAEFGVGPFYLLEVDRRSDNHAILEEHWANYGAPGHVEFPFEWWSGAQIDRDVLDLSIEFHLILAGARFHFRTVEFVDFLAGLLTIDLRRDDLVEPTPEVRRQWLATLREGDGWERERVIRKLRRLGGAYAGGMGYAVYSDPQLRTPGQERAIGLIEDYFGTTVQGQESLETESR
ncbi:MAG: hypothetical protein H6834_11800 [Planctomycetes bacterium]|nr:hypothetical protein [Planctomycetota bacterium]